MSVQVANEPDTLYYKVIQDAKDQTRFYVHEEVSPEVARGGVWRFVGGKRVHRWQHCRVRIDLWSCHSTGHLGGSLV